ncbi:MAG: YkvA family protein [Bacillota bacterium]
MSKSILGIYKFIKFMLDDEVKFSKKLLFIIPLVYFISPIDFIPDYFFPVVGWLDDVGLLVVMFPFLKRILAKYNPSNSDNNSDGDGNSEDDDVINIDDDDYKFK